MNNTELSSIDIEWGEACPMGIILIDSDGYITWVNRKIIEISNIQLNQLVGQSLENTDNQVIQLLLQHQGSICIPQTDGSLRYLKPFRKTVSHSEGRQLSVLFFEDISEIAMLRHQINELQDKAKELQLNDELTGLPNKKAFMHALNAQVSRTRRYGNPLSLITLQMHSSNGKELAETQILETAYCLRDRLRWVDTIGHIQRDLFMMILPETSHQDAIVLVKKIYAGLDENQISAIVSIGFTSWQQGQDPDQLVALALQNADKGNLYLSDQG